MFRSTLVAWTAATAAATVVAAAGGTSEVSTKAEAALAREKWPNVVFCCLLVGSIAHQQQ